MGKPHGTALHAVVLAHVEESTVSKISPVQATVLDAGIHARQSEALRLSPRAPCNRSGSS